MAARGRSHLPWTQGGWGRQAKGQNGTKWGLGNQGRNLALKLEEEEEEDDTLNRIVTRSVRTGCWGVGGTRRVSLFQGPP